MINESNQLFLKFRIVRESVKESPIIVWRKDRKNGKPAQESLPRHPMVDNMDKTMADGKSKDQEKEGFVWIPSAFSVWHSDP